MLFTGATSFDQPLNWDTSKVTNMEGMFDKATAFNQAIGNWKISNVNNMGSMFFSAINFNQDISSWNVSKVTNYVDFALYSALTSANAPSKDGTKLPTTK